MNFHGTEKKLQKGSHDLWERNRKIVYHKIWNPKAWIIESKYDIVTVGYEKNIDYFYYMYIHPINIQFIILNNYCMEQSHATVLDQYRGFYLPLLAFVCLILHTVLKISKL